MKIMCLKVPEKLLNGPCGEDCLHQVLIYFWTRWSSSTHGNGEELQELTAVWTHIYIKLSSVFCWNCTFTDFPKYLQCVCVCVWRSACGQTLTSSARLKRLSCRSLMYSDFTLLFQQAGPFSERFPVSTMINLRENKDQDLSFLTGLWSWNLRKPPAFD